MSKWVIKILEREAARVLSSFFVLCICLMIVQAGSAKTEERVPLIGKFIYPVDYAPMSLSGTYGELRSNHFHGGVDFRVGGVSGAPILAAADGYVSKITVSPSGYGNALYITHPDLYGYVTVYGHMQKFADHIQEFVRDEQYEKESFAVSMELDSLFFPVKQGEIIGYAGNTGSSGGPHLHFEIRNDENCAEDYLFWGMLKAEMVDNMPPVFNRVEFFGYSQVYGAPKTFRVERPREAGAVIKVPMYFYAAIDATDKMEGTNAKLAVKSYKVFLDTAQVYSLYIGDVPFDKGRYINSLTEYSLRVQRRKAFIKTYMEPGNMLSYMVNATNDGIMVLTDTLKHKVRIETCDYKGNMSQISYTVQRVDSLYTSQMGDKPEGTFAAWHLANILERPGFKLTIPAASLYSSTYLSLDSASTRVTPYAPVWKIHKPVVPLHTPATVYIKYTGPDSLASKAMLASVSANGRLYGAGGGVVEYGSDGKGGNDGGSAEVLNGVEKSAGGTDEENCVSGTVGKSLYVSGKLYSFGNYTVAVDTTAPYVKANFNNGAVLKGNVISFTIRDRMSGIRSYRVEIDGHWVLAEFDAKTARLRVPLKDARIKRGIVHKAVATVIDNKGNKTVVKRSFKW